MTTGVPRDGSPRFLHLALDEKFIPFAVKSFEAAFPGCNEFRIADPGRGPLKFVQPAANLRRVPLRYWFSTELARDLAACDCLVVHYMTPMFARAVVAAPPSVAVVWGAWGGDFYHLLPDFSHRLHLPETKQLMAGLRRPVLRVGRLAGRLQTLLMDLVFPRAWEGRALGRIDAATMLPGEHRMLTAAQPAFRARHHHFQYYSAEDVLLKGPQLVQGPDILVGNSAFPNNNHLDAFAFLRRLELGDRRIVAPLGYGDPDYAEAVCAAGARIFGRRFVPLREFVALEDFNRELAACEVVVMNHVRQQAFGTINTAMIKGAKIFLRPENPLLEFYRGMGARVFELDESCADSEEFLRPLAAEEARVNRAALLEFCSFESAVATVRGLAQVVAGKRGAAESRSGAQHV